MTTSARAVAPIDLGQEMHGWAADLFPLNRSLSGPGTRETLDYLGRLLPGLQRHRVASGTRVFDWIVPPEWRPGPAYIETLDGYRVCDVAENTLHLVGYSDPFEGILSLEELKPHLHSLPERPDWIPYVTAYYRDYWGFCMRHRDVQALEDVPYRVVIKGELSPGHLDYADLSIPGESTDEILVSTYVCHPSMANNELSGPVVATALARHLASLPKLKYTYRFVFIPETIGAIVYLHAHLEQLKARVRAGFVITCVGDERTYSYIPSRQRDTLADRVIQYTFASEGLEYDAYDFTQRGSDERQYCWPGIDLPVASVTRSKYGVYPEYHTSADDLTLVTAAGLKGSFNFYRRAFEVLEMNGTYRAATIGEPQLGRRGLRSDVSVVGANTTSQINYIDYVNWLVYSDGQTDALDIAARLKLPLDNARTILQRLLQEGLLTPSEMSA